MPANPHRQPSCRHRELLLQGRLLPAPQAGDEVVPTPPPSHQPRQVWLPVLLLLLRPVAVSAGSHSSG